MKVALLGDIHGHPFREFSNYTTGFNSRLVDINLTLDAFFSKVELLGIRDVIVLGDIFHDKNKLDIVTAQTIYRTFQASVSHIRSIYSFNITFIMGNHDFCCAINEVDFTTIYHFQEFGPVFTKPTYQHITDIIKFIYLPYDHLNNTARDLSELLSLQPHNARIFIFGHLDVKGATAGTIDLPIGQDIDPNLFNDRRIKGTFLGHYHTHQSIKSGGTDIIYVGSPIQHTASEEGHDKGFVVLDVDTGGWEFRKLHDKKNGFITIDVQNEDEILAAVDTKLYNPSAKIRAKLPVGADQEVITLLQESGIKIEREVVKSNDTRLELNNTTDIMSAIPPYVNHLVKDDNKDELINVGKTILQEVT